jgi:hypothetical protein
MEETWEVGHRAFYRQSNHIDRLRDGESQKSFIDLLLFENLVLTPLVHPLICSMQCVELHIDPQCHLQLGNLFLLETNSTGIGF